MGKNGGGGGRGFGRLNASQRPVDEGTRIDIAKVLMDFQASGDESVTFPPGLTNHERAVVHSECKRYGFKSKSYGKNETRRVTVFKPKARHQVHKFCHRKRKICPERAQTIISMYLLLLLHSLLPR